MNTQHSTTQRRDVRVLVAGLLLATLLVADAGVAQSSDAGAEPARTDQTTPIAAVAELEQRLARLDTNDPGACFALGEDIAYHYASESALALARQLLVVAWLVDREAPAEDRLDLGPSVCVVLADIAPLDERRYLLALADTLRTTPTSTATSVSVDAALDAPSTPSNPAALHPREILPLSHALARFRAGDGGRLRDLLESIDPLPVFDAAGVADQDARRLVRAFDTLASDPRCPRCRNERIVRSTPDDDTPLRYTICPNCNGHPGPNLTVEQLTATVRAEAKLLGVAADSWSAQRLIDAAAPIRSLDPDQLPVAVGLPPNARTYHFTPGRPFDGTWR